MIRILRPIRILTAADLSVCARYCESVSQWVQLNAELAAIRDPAAKDHPTRRVEQYRIEYARWDRARVEAAKGLFGLNPITGKSSRNPYVQAERDADAAMAAIERRIKTERRDTKERMHKDEGELGLTPASRERMSIQTPKPMGKLERFMGRKNGMKGG